MTELPTPDPQNVTRRRFIKRSGGATVGTVLGLNVLNSPSWADQVDDSGKWSPGSEAFTIDVEVDHDAAIDYIWPLNTIPPAGQSAVSVASMFEDKAALKTYLGWTSEQKTTKSFTQTVSWEEWWPKADGTGDAPSKFRKLSWSYGGNHFVDVEWDTNNNKFALLNGKKVGMVIYTEATFAGDLWELGGFVLTAYGPGSSSTLAAGSTVSPLYYPSQLSQIQPDDKAKAEFGIWATNYSIQPQSVEAAGSWPGTGDGVGHLEVKHMTGLVVHCYIEFTNGHLFSSYVLLGGRLKGSNAKITTSDWWHRPAQISNGVHYPAKQAGTPASNSEIDLWDIHTERPPE